MCVLGETLEPFDVDGTIPAFGFGDSFTRDNSVFSLNTVVRTRKTLNIYSMVIISENAFSNRDFFGVIVLYRYALHHNYASDKGRAPEGCTEAQKWHIP